MANEDREQSMHKKRAGKSRPFLRCDTFDYKE